MYKLFNKILNLEQQINQQGNILNITNINFTLAVNIFLTIKNILNRKVVFICPDDIYVERVADCLADYDIEKKNNFYLKFDYNKNESEKYPVSLEKIIEYYNNTTKNKSLICDALSFSLQYPDFKIIEQSGIKLIKNKTCSMEKLIESLIEYGFNRESLTFDKRDFSVRGSLIDIYPENFDNPVRIDFFGDEITSIRYFDISTQTSICEIEQVTIYPEILEFNDSEVKNNILDIIDEQSLLLFYEPKIIENRLEQENNNNYILQNILDITEQYDRNVIHLSLLQNAGYKNQTVLNPEIQTSIILENSQKNSLVSIIKKYQPALWREQTSEKPSKKQLNGWTHSEDFLVEDDKEDYNLPDSFSFIMSVEYDAQVDRLEKLLRNENIEFNKIDLENIDFDSIKQNATKLYITISKYDEPFILEKEKIIFFPEIAIKENKYVKRKPFILQKKSAPIESFTELKEGDYIVHIDYGIGLYEGINTLDVQGVKQDYINLRYEGDGQLFLPIDQIDKIQKYISGDGESKPYLYKLGGTAWQKIKLKAKKKIDDLAKDLVDLYAKRKMVKGYSFKEDMPWQLEFESGFAYEETPDQLKALNDVKNDMQSDKVMDRLVCGDVGYGKTEIAIRACLKSVIDGKQAAILSPTTILTEQHYNTFVERLKNYPFKIDVISRFRTKKEQTEIVGKLKSGEIDIIIGTHRLLSKDIKFYDLGLLVVDEEQRFGVKHKEKIKQMKTKVDVLSLTATPIPRTLHMALTGIRDISIINTAPENRKPIKVFVLKSEKIVIQEAIKNELDRNGQVYFVHNRIDTIEVVAANIQKIIPSARIAVAHGRMKNTDLENIMYDFYKHKFDVLVSTTIIENGLDISNVNTIIINNADNFGLAQLYQLKGRIGRSDRQGYAYLLHRGEKVLSTIAKKRLSVIKQNNQLGAGFKIAMHDLEIRGSGNILGPEQSGVIVEIGYDLYSKLLDESIAVLQGSSLEEKKECVIKYDVTAYIPETYIRDTNIKIAFYKKLVRVETIEELNDIKNELTDRFGKLPGATNKLVDISELRIIAIQNGVNEIIFNDDAVKIRFYEKNERYYLKLCQEFGNINYSKTYPNGIIYYFEDPDEDKISEITLFLLELKGETDAE